MNNEYRKADMSAFSCNFYNISTARFLIIIIKKTINNLFIYLFIEKKMTAIHIVNTFTYPLGKEDIVKKAKELAHRNGVSFSAYVVELLEQEVQKKVEAQTDPLNLSRQTCEFPPATINNHNTLDAFMPYDKLRDRVSEIDDTSTLSTLVRNGRVIETVAKTKLIKIKKNQ